MTRDDKATGGKAPDPDRERLEREWAAAVQRGLRKGKPPVGLGKPKKAATKKGRRAK